MYIFPSLALSSSVQWRFAHQIAEIRWGRNLARHAECALTKPTACCLWFLYMSILKEMQNVYQYCKWQLTWRNSKIKKFISAWMEPFANSFFVYIQMLIFTQLTDKPLRIFFLFFLACVVVVRRIREHLNATSRWHQCISGWFKYLRVWRFQPLEFRTFLHCSLTSASTHSTRDHGSTVSSERVQQCYKTEEYLIWEKVLFISGCLWKQHSSKTFLFSILCPGCGYFQCSDICIFTKRSC